MERPDAKTTIGIVAYVAALLWQWTQSGPLSDDNLLLVLPIAIVGILLMTYGQRGFGLAALGFSLTTTAALWTMATIAAKPALADDGLLIAAPLAFIGTLLVARSRQQTNGFSLGAAAVATVLVVAMAVTPCTELGFAVAALLVGVRLKRGATPRTPSA